MQAHNRLWQSAVAFVLFSRAVQTMAPTLCASIIPLLPTISHFAFDFDSQLKKLEFEPLSCFVPPLTAPFGSLPNTQWFQDTASRKRKKQ